MADWFKMIPPGLYKVAFRNGANSGTGVLVLEEDGTFKGGDTYLAYTGSIGFNQGILTAKLRTFRHSPGHPSIFGQDQVDLSFQVTPNSGGFSILNGPVQIEGISLKKA